MYLSLTLHTKVLNINILTFNPNKLYGLLFFLLLLPSYSFGQSSVQLQQKAEESSMDTLKQTRDTLKTRLYPRNTLKQTRDSSQQTPDTLKTKPNITRPDSVSKQGVQLEAKVDYTATDSMVLFSNGRAMLYGAGKVVYNTPQKVELKADFIRANMDSSAVYASGVADSVGNITGEPIFSQGEESYDASYIAYNFKTQKGYVKGGVTKQDEGYIVARESKRNKDNTIYMRNGRYTTCDKKDHPHYYMQLTKAKVKPGSYIATGPAYFVIADIPLPLAIPFGFFPFTNTYSSGIIMPSYGDEMSRGFYLKNGGYYFAFNDFFDLAITGDIYTKGTWALTGASKYRKRYRYSGSITASYREDVLGEEGLSDYSLTKNFKLYWKHQQDAKANPYSTFGASVDFTTSGYNVSNVNNYYNPAVQSKNVTSSSVNYTKRFPESAWSLSANLSASQRTSDSTISMTLPSLTATMSRIYPFKRKHGVGKDRFYEKIALSYNMTISNSITANEKEFMDQSLVKDWKNGIKHTLPISASFSMFKYFTVTPSMSNTLRNYTKKVKQSWNESEGAIERDTTYGFYNVYDFSLGVNMSTKLYGFYIPNRWLFGDKIDRIRHVLTPSIGISYHPDYEDNTWGYYGHYQKPVYDTDGETITSYQEVAYSNFAGSLYGTPSQGLAKSMTFSLQNNLEMKVKSKSDTTDNAFRKISLVDNFALNGSYNFAADSMNLSMISATMRLKLTKTLAFNLTGKFDPYMYEVNGDGTPYRTGSYRWNNGLLPRFLGTGSSFQYTINNDTFKAKDRPTEDDKDQGKEGEGDFNPDGDSMASDGTGNRRSGKKGKSGTTETGHDGYELMTIPWSFSVNYSFNWRASSDIDDFNTHAMAFDRVFTHNLSFSGNIAPTPKWQVSYTGTFNLEDEQITQMTMSIMRDLHCWRLSASVTPFGYYKSYMVTVGINASMLEDAKYEKRSDASSDITWY